MNEIISFAGDDRTVTAYRIGVGLVLALVGVRLARRSSATLGMFLGAVGLSDVLATSFAEIDALHPLLWSDAGPVDLVWTSVFLGAAVWWAVGRRLTEVRAERLFFLVLLAGLLSQWEFAADPFGPLLGFAGMGFVVFGLVWGFLTGGGWANEASERFPRSSRTFLLLGYSIFSIALLNWFSASHDIDQLASFEGFGANGVYLLGYPLLYALFTLGMSGAVADRPIDRPPTDPVPEVTPAVDEPVPAA
jgi:hypothetical protein